MVLFDTLVHKYATDRSTSGRPQLHTHNNSLTILRNLSIFDSLIAPLRLVPVQKSVWRQEWQCSLLALPKTLIWLPRCIPSSELLCHYRESVDLSQGRHAHFLA